MTLAALMQSRATAIRAKLWRPHNAVPDHGIDLGGKAIRKAQAEAWQRTIADNKWLFEQERIENSNRKAK